RSVRNLRKSWFYWLQKLNLFCVVTYTIRARIFKKGNDPIFGRELKQAIKSRNVKIKPRVTVVDGKKVTFSDGSSLDVNQTIWATGFVPAYEMNRIDGTIDKKGKPIHNRGISPIDGLYYIRLPLQVSRGSVLIGGVVREAM